ncbi:hypothetical protein [Endozoicomonas sp. GU-1]|uniref:hypothetical protein n=1 Tax=Endozoicomonas sp. GU-1 TaxID=3009078 RepID=UPI0022B35DA2|nr:hypothetical protein [Endozoicomonas sp. GU-1]WBA82307.1 hypothetical protein O2T12_03890 [Endozoicomonas sp. GU-1]WBA85243.1 hypothetical protein O3276_18575 [Endozoicomonas sp. GU-1]
MLAKLSGTLSLSSLSSLSYNGSQPDSSSTQADFRCRKVATSDPQHIYQQGVNSGHVNLAMRCITRAAVSKTAKVMQKNPSLPVKAAGYLLEVGMKLGSKQMLPVLQSQINSISGCYQV